MSNSKQNIEASIKTQVDTFIKLLEKTYEQIIKSKINISTKMKIYNKYEKERQNIDTEIKRLSLEEDSQQFSKNISNLRNRINNSYKSRNTAINTRIIFYKNEQKRKNEKNLLTAKNVKNIKVECKANLKKKGISHKTYLPHHINGNINGKLTTNTKEYRNCKNTYQGRTNLIGQPKTKETKGFLYYAQPPQGGKKLLNKNIKKGGLNILKNENQEYKKFLETPSSNSGQTLYQQQLKKLMKDNKDIDALNMLKKIAKYGLTSCPKEFPQEDANCQYKKCKMYLGLKYLFEYLNTGSRAETLYKDHKQKLEDKIRIGILEQMNDVLTHVYNNPASSLKPPLIHLLIFLSLSMHPNFGLDKYSMYNIAYDISNGPPGLVDDIKNLELNTIYAKGDGNIYIYRKTSGKYISINGSPPKYNNKIETYQAYFEKKNPSQGGKKSKTTKTTKVKSNKQKQK